MNRGALREHSGLHKPALGNAVEDELHRQRGQQNAEDPADDVHSGDAKDVLHFDSNQKRGQRQQ